MAKFAVVFLAVVCSLSSASADVINPKLRSALADGKTANVFVTLQGTESVISSLNAQRFSDRNARLNSVASSLKAHAKTAQANILSVLEKSRINHESFWISNEVFIPNAPLSLVEKLASMPEVSAINEEVHIPVAAPQINAVHEGKQSRANQWGVLKIEADRVWAMPGGNTGEGIVVSNVDTGVRWTHVDLRNNYLGDYGWFQPTGRSAMPLDNNGHGTHTMGTIAGADGIGVAPGSRWMACQGCATSSCSQFDLTSCGQFIACPTLADGSAADCTKAPHLVSNSWGGGQGQTFYHSVVAAWRAAGIVPFFSAGNNGAGCRSLGYPGEHEDVIGVGSTVSDDSLSSFSSRGPKSDGTIKPDISGPGSNVYSAYHTSDTAYSTLSGTSMSCPHAAGAGALLLSDNGNLDYNGVKGSLEAGCDTDIIQTGGNCGGVSENFFPNNAFGHGRINVYKSIIGRK